VQWFHALSSDHELGVGKYEDECDSARRWIAHRVPTELRLGNGILAFGNMGIAAESRFRWTWFCASSIIAFAMIDLFPTIELFLTAVFGVILFTQRRQVTTTHHRRILRRRIPEMFSAGIFAAMLLFFIVLFHG
jgi:hypothetical protein